MHITPINFTGFQRATMRITVKTSISKFETIQIQDLIPKVQAIRKRFDLALTSRTLVKLLKLTKGLTGYFYNSGSEVQDVQGNEVTFTYNDFVESTVVEIQSAAPPAGSLFVEC